MIRTGFEDLWQYFGLLFRRAMLYLFASSSLKPFFGFARCFFLVNIPVVTTHRQSVI